ncbi:discoidin domain-containing protein [Paenibacillus sacheonensis]|uniref:F5/8 type C domain-containing protein n=1 Tax=Paenibacillus sacheonensis TaxID=742054 RepID=A0A7X4YQ96_9BACL|nr:discoidin domain-containing protein [Paenibacillus sacheonensis]NBC70543.1 hypothetical protein [Paenibacillus sacheonensis]
MKTYGKPLKRTMLGLVSIALAASLFSASAFAAQDSGVTDIDLTGAAAWASSETGGGWNEGPANAIDDNIYTKWATSTTESMPQSLVIDLGAAYDGVSELRYFLGDYEWTGRIMNHEIWVSTDNVGWTKAYEGEWPNAAGQWRTDDFAPVTARYVKLVAVSAGQNESDPSSRASATEIKIAYSSDAPPAAEQLTGTLSAPATAGPGQSIDASIGVAGVNQAFAVGDLTVSYDPSRLEFATTADENGNLSLAENAYASLRDGIAVVGSAVKPALGQVRLLLAKTGSQDISTDGALLQLHGKVKADATVGSAALSVLSLSLTKDEVTVSADVTAASLSIAISIDSHALRTAIDAAQAKHDAAVEGSGVGQYLPGAKAALQTAIDSASAVLRNASATQLQINDAAAALAAAVSEFDGKLVVAPADRTALTAAISAAQSKHDAAVEGTKIGKYAAGAKAALQAAIDAAGAVNAGTKPSQAQVDQATSALNAAVQTFLTKLITLIPGETSVTIKDLMLLIKHFGIASTDEDWSAVAAADVFDNGEITIQTLAAVARLILDEWLAQ